MSGLTLKQLAKLAGVSKTTVSYVFSNNPEIPEKTKNKILSMAKKYNYRPNFFAQSLNTGKTKTIGVIFTNALGVFMGEIIKGIEDVIFEHGYHSLVCTCNDDQKREKAHLDMLLHKGVDGIIAFIVTKGVKGPEAYNHWVNLKKKGVPLVFIDRYLPGEDIDYVVCDDFAGAYDAVTHLVNLGHKKIAHISKNDDCTSIQNRLAGYKRALVDAGIEVNNDYIVVADADNNGADIVTLKLLKMKNPPTAIFTVTDGEAIEALQTIRKQGKKVPEDIALVGFGDSLKAAMMTPPITTVTQAKEELGQKAAEILLETLEQGKNTKLKQFLIRPELIVRESSFNMKSGQRNTVKNVEK